jgi:MYXO-CTERM domain-containing protein
MEIQMRNKTFISSMVGVAAAVSVAGSATAGTAGWTATYDFNNASLFQVTAGQADATYFTGGDGGGFYPRSGAPWTGQSGVNTSYENGAMRYTHNAANPGPAGARLYLNGGPDLSTYRNDYWTPKMAKAENPYLSVQVYNGEMQGSVHFYTFAVDAPLTTFGSHTNYAYRGITVNSDGTVTTYRHSTVSGGSGNFAMQSGWNTIAMQLTSDGTLNYLLNGSIFYSVANAGGTASSPVAHNYLMDAWNAAAGFRSEAGASMLFDNFVVGSGGGVIPAPGALALLGVAGLAGARRRRA